jgi:hypothetical protein
VEEGDHLAVGAQGRGGRGVPGQGDPVGDDRDPDAVGDPVPAAGAGAAAGGEVQPRERLRARSRALPVLRARGGAAGVDLRPRHPAGAGRAHHLAERRHRLRALQPAEGGPHPRPGADGAPLRARQAGAPPRGRAGDAGVGAGHAGVDNG